MFWDKRKGYIIGSILGIISIVCSIPLILTHTLEGIFLAGWLGIALGYLGVIFAIDQYNNNKNSHREIININEELLEDEESIDVDEFEHDCTITINKYYSKNYIERLTDKKSQEKIQNRSRSVDACIIDTEGKQEDAIEL